LRHPCIPIVNPPQGYYRLGKEWAYTFAAIQYTKGTPQYDTMMAAMWTILGQIVDTWPILDADGATFDLFATAFWYDGALKYYHYYNPTLTLVHTAQLELFPDKTWNEWAAYQDTDEDDPDYGTGSLLILDAWCQLPTRSFPADFRLWRHYAEQIANDGSYPAYGDAGTPGQYFRSLVCAELAARRTQDGRYKWLAHRAFWRGRDHLLALLGGSHVKETYTALAYS